MNSCRRGRTARSEFLGHVLGRPSRREDGDAGPARRLGVVLGHHRQQVPALFRASEKGMDRFEEIFWSGHSLEELYDTLSARPDQRHGRGVRRRHARMEALVQQRRLAPSWACRRASRRCSTCPSPARSSGSNRSCSCWPPSPPPRPFVGLFGTVWGIMTSFRSIAASKNTSLAVVAPGIAEALFATAIGLFAAIPGARRLQQAAGPRGALAGAPGKLRRRILVHPVAPDRPARRRRTRPGGMTLQTR